MFRHLPWCMPLVLLVTITNVELPNMEGGLVEP